MTKTEMYKTKRRMANAYANVSAGVAAIATTAFLLEEKPVIKLAIAGSGLIMTTAGVIATCREIDEAAHIYSEMDRYEKALADIEETLDMYC